MMTSFSPVLTLPAVEIELRDEVVIMIVLKMVAAAEVEVFQAVPVLGCQLLPLAVLTAVLEDQLPFQVVPVQLFVSVAEDQPSLLTFYLVVVLPIMAFADVDRSVVQLQLPAQLVLLIILVEYQLPLEVALDLHKPVQIVVVIMAVPSEVQLQEAAVEDQIVVVIMAVPSEVMVAAAVEAAAVEDQLPLKLKKVAEDQLLPLKVLAVVE